MLSMMTFLRTGDILAKATTQRTNFPFNSFCNFNGAFLAAGPNGLASVGVSDTDNGVPINAFFSPILTDFGTSASKRMRYIYFSFDATGPLQMKLSADDGNDIPYQIPVNLEKLQRVKFKVGEGTRGVYWRFKFENVDGCWFNFNRIEVEPTMKKLGTKNS